LEQIQAQYSPLGFTFDNRLTAMATELQNGDLSKRAMSSPAKARRLSSGGGVTARKLRAS
jgi:hypothetical protein